MEEHTSKLDSSIMCCLCLWSVIAKGKVIEVDDDVPVKKEKGEGFKKPDKKVRKGLFMFYF